MFLPASSLSVGSTDFAAATQFPAVLISNGGIGSRYGRHSTLDAKAKKFPGPKPDRKMEDRNISIFLSGMFLSQSDAGPVAAIRLLGVVPEGRARRRRSASLPAQSTSCFFGRLSMGPGVRSLVRVKTVLSTRRWSTTSIRATSLGWRILMRVSRSDRKSSTR